MSRARSPRQERLLSAEQFVGRHLDDLVRLATALAGDRTIGEDLVADALLACLPRWGQIRTSQLAYVRRAITHRFINDRRTRWRTVSRAVPELPDRAAEAPDAVVARIDLEQELQRLSAEQRTVVVLRYLNDLPVNTVAKILDRPEGTIRRIEAINVLRTSHLGAEDPIPHGERDAST